MNKNYFYSIFLTVLLFGCTTAQVNNTIKTVGGVLSEDGLSESDIAAGLKEALVNGISKGSDQASKIDGFFKNSLIKLLIPEEMTKVENTLRDLGQDKLVDDFVLSLNRAAEDASKEAKPIFVSAIKSMTVQDAWAILKGEDNAATEYLKRSTSTQLYNAFKPVIENSLEKVNATKYYEKVTTAYNKVPFVKEVNTDLPDYTTNRAMDGLFTLIEGEEKNIRENPVARTSELLKKVFTKENME